jgi:hypothetical protein
MTPKNDRTFLWAGYTFHQEQTVKRKRHDLSLLKEKSDQSEPIRVPQYERD